MISHSATRSARFDGDRCVDARRVGRRAVLPVAGLLLASSLVACTAESGPASSSAPGTASSSVYKPAPTSPTSLPSASVRPVPSTAVAAPSPGSIDSTVATRAPSLRAAVPLAATGSFGRGVTIRVTAVKSVTAMAERPGEVSGPGLAVTVRISNQSGKAIDLGDVIVDLSDDTGAPADPMTASPARPFNGRLADDRSASGVYVYTIDRRHRTPVTIKVSYTSAAPVVVFAGNVS